jgi:hypothetical protein
MTSAFKKSFLTLCFFFFSVFSFAQTRWSFELQFGVVHSLNLPLIIRQEGYTELRIAHANFYSEPLIDPPYWDVRLTKWIKKKSIEIEFVHHKFYLRNLPPEVSRFGISHGFNMVFINHAREAGKYILRAGIGTGIIHPESTIRGMKYPEGTGFDIAGHRVRGVALNLSGARQFKINKTFFVNVEAKMHAAVADAPVVNGYARVHIVVFQLILGPGVNWCMSEK